MGAATDLKSDGVSRLGVQFLRDPYDSSVQLAHTAEES